MSEQVIGTFAPAEEQRPLIVIETEILWYKRQVGGGLLEIGRRLIEAKAQLEHGEWLAWLKDRVDFSEVKAQRLMRLAREYSNPSALTDLGVTKALALLALPESEREEFASETHTVNGAEKTVLEMSTRELEQAIRERDEARLAAARSGPAWRGRGGTGTGNLCGSNTCCPMTRTGAGRRQGSGRGEKKINFSTLFTLGVMYILFHSQKKGAENVAIPNRVW